MVRRRHPAKNPPRLALNAIIEQLEERRLLSGLTISSSLLVFNSAEPGTSGGGPSATDAVTLTNTGSSTVTFSPGAVTIIDDPNATTEKAVSTPGAFSVTNLSNFPSSLAPNTSTTLTLDFTASQVGEMYQSALLQIQSSDSTNPTIDVALHGLATAGQYGYDEPSLVQVLRAYDIPTIVGDGPNDANYANSQYPETPDPSSQEVTMPRLVKAAPGAVTITPLATFNSSAQPTVRVGTYTPGEPTSTSELFTVGQAYSQAVNPVAQGATTFDPGSNPFSLYAVFPGTSTPNGQPDIHYSESAFNTLDPSNPIKFRFFPMENADGSVVPNTYIVAAEDYNSSTYNSFVNFVGIIGNVAPASDAAGAPAIGLENLDGTPGSTEMVFNRIQNLNPQDPSGFVDTVHNTNTMQINNSGDQPLVISALTLSDTTNWELVNPPTLPATIAPGGDLDVTIQFIATTDPPHTTNETNDYSTTNGVSVSAAGGVWNATLSVVSNDPVFPSYVMPLAGYWQYMSENENEPSLQTITNMMYGYGTTISNTVQPEYPNSGKTAIYYGEEVNSELWDIADPTQPVSVVQIDAYHNQYDPTTMQYPAAQIGWYAGGDSGSVHELFQDVSGESQSVLPYAKNGSTSVAASGSFSPGSTTFGWDLDGEYSQHALNTADINTYGRSGHAVRFYPLRTSSGQIVPNTWLVAMDYENTEYDNSDFQDNVYVVTNMRPATQAAAPEDLEAAAAAGGGVSLEWAAVSDSSLKGYNVYAATSEAGPYTKLNSSLLTQTSFIDTGATPGVAEYYRVTAVDSAGESEGSGASETLPASTGGTAPDAPSGLTATGSSAGIFLAWSETSTVAGFNVLRSSSASGPFTQLNSSLVTGDSYDDASAPTGTSYYEVIAVDSSGDTSTPATANATRTGSGTGGTTLSFSNGKIARYTDAAGHVVTLRLSGPGSGQAVFNGSDADPDVITLSDTTGKSSFTITVAGGGSTNIGQVIVGGSLNRFSATHVELLGDMTVDGALSALQIAGATGGNTLILQAASKNLSLSLGNVSDLSIQSAGPIATLKATAWAATQSNANTITAPSIGHLTVTGQFAADLDLTGTGVDLTAASIRGSLNTGQWTLAGSAGQITAAGTVTGWAADIAGAVTTLNMSGDFDGILTVGSLRTLHVGGSLSGATVQITGTSGVVLRNLTVGGAITNTQLRSAGSIGTVQAAALVNSNLFAGVAGGVTTLPTGSGNFSGSASVAVVNVSGRKNPFAVQNSNVAAASLGRVTFGALNTDNGGTAFGLAANTLVSYTRKVDGKTLRWTDKMSVSLLTNSGDAVARVFSAT